MVCITNYIITSICQTLLKRKTTYIGINIGYLRCDSEDVSLQKPVFINQVKSVGLVIDKTGIVHDKSDVFQYLLIGKDDVRTVDGRSIPYSEIKQMSYVEKMHTVAFKYADSEDEAEDVVYGSHFPEEEIPMFEMPHSTSALNDAFDILYPKNREQLYYDELREREMIDMTMLDRPDMGVRPFSDRILAMYHDHIQRRLTYCGFIGGRYPSNDVMDEVLRIRVGDRRRNLFREWVESHEWDGKPRLRTCFIDYCGVEAPALQDDGAHTPEEMQYIGDVTEAWFIGGIKRMYDEIAHEVVPVLIGGQGAGKTNALRFIAGDNDWYRSTTADVSQPARFLETIRGAIVVELGESKQIRTADNETLKAFISQSCDQLRMPYARYDESYPRHFIMIATSNMDSVFTDLTGSRRFYPLYCNPRNAVKSFPTTVRGARYQYEIEQIWAEALHLYNEGHRWFVPKATIPLAKKMQKFCAVENPGLSLIDTYLDDPANKLTKRGSRITRAMIMRDIFQIDPGLPPTPQAETMYRAWKLGTDRWMQSPKPFSINGKTVRGFSRIYEPGEEIPEVTFKMVDGGEDAEPAASVESRFSQLLSAKGIDKEDALIDMSGIPDEEIEEYLSEGLIYNLGTNSHPEFHVGCLVG